MAICVVIYHFGRPTRPWSNGKITAPADPDPEEGFEGNVARGGSGDLMGWMRYVWVFIVVQWITTATSYQDKIIGRKN